jgi:hypothetical protein
MEALRNTLSRDKLAYMLAILIVLNAIRFWPHKKLDAEPGFPPLPPGRPANGAPPSPNFNPGDPSGPPDRERMEAMLRRLPAEQRKVVEERMEADRKFFDSIRDLPEQELRQKAMEHFAQNPPPFLPGADGAPMPLPSGGGAGGGGTPGADFFGKGGMHLPPPEVRRSMDQQIANGQKKGNP